VPGSLDSLDSDEEALLPTIDETTERSTTWQSSLGGAEPGGEWEAASPGGGVVASGGLSESSDATADRDLVEALDRAVGEARGGRGPQLEAPGRGFGVIGQSIASLRARLRGV